jgi:hypothetical protein
MKMATIMIEVATVIKIVNWHLAFIDIVMFIIIFVNTREINYTSVIK